MAGYGRLFSIAGSAGINRSLLSSRSSLPNLQPCATITGKKLEKLGLPPKPKRPLTPYFKFMSAERQKVTTAEPNLRTQDVVKKMAQIWANYDPQEKEKLRKMYEVEVLDYAKQMMVYEQSITPEQKRIIRDAKEMDNTREKKLRFKKKLEELGKPKKPPTGFIQFMQETKFTNLKDGKVTDWMQSIAEKWKKMSIDEKAKYQFESHKLMQQYKQDLRVWEENMVRLGHLEVVRIRGLRDLKIKSAAKTQ